MWKQNGNEHLNVYHQYVYVTIETSMETMCYTDWKKNPLIRFIPTFYCSYSIHRVKKPSLFDKNVSAKENFSTGPTNLSSCDASLRMSFFLQFFLSS